MKEKCAFFLKLILIFSLFYDINFVFMPSITTARIAFFVLLLFSLDSHISFPKAAVYFLGFILFIFLLSLVQFYFSADFNQNSRIIWFAIYGVITPILLRKHFNNINEFLLIISIAVGLQALLSILSFINPAIKGLYYNLIIFTANFDETLTIRATGFTSTGGAGLSVIQSVGVISTLMFIRLNKFGLRKNILLWLLVLLILISTLIIGRTGLFISVFAIAIYFFSYRIRMKNIAIAGLLILVLCQIDYTSFLENATSNVQGFNTELFTSWIGNAFSTKDNATAEDLGSMPVPPLTWKTIWGTGLIKDESGIANASGNDSGYIQTYYSLGLIIAILFYVSYLIFLILMVKKQRRNALYILLFLLFLMEIKEPFIFQHVFPCFILGTILLINKEKVKGVYMQSRLQTNEG